jgi:acyl-CoA hydrolase
MQQGYKATEEELANLEDTVKDFAAALLGRNITLGKKLDYFAKDTVEVPQSGPPSTSEVDRVMSWASCVDCSGQLTMICPTCARDVLKQAKDAIVEVKEATHKPEKLSRLTFAIGIINGVRFVLRMGHDNSR